MAKRGPKTHHVVPNKEKKGWDVVRGGAKKATSHHKNKKPAVSAGRKLSRSHGTELRIHNKDGKISGSDSHGNDPRKIKG